MDPTTIDYSGFMDRAFRNVIADVVRHVARNGLPGDHHLYITFRTDHPDTEVPDWLRAQHPEVITIVLQYEFHGLKTHRDGFSVQLSFGDVPAKIRVPYDAIEVFADPAVRFGLQFTQEEPGDAVPERPAAGVAATSEPKGQEERDAPEAENANVVQLDHFRH